MTIAYSILNYYLIDWAALILVCFQLYFLSEGKRSGFVFGMFASFFGLIFGILAGSFATIFFQTIFVLLNYRGYKKSEPTRSKKCNSCELSNKDR